MALGRSTSRASAVPRCRLHVMLPNLVSFCNCQPSRKNAFWQMGKSHVMLHLLTGAAHPQYDDGVRSTQFVTRSVERLVHGALGADRADCAWEQQI